VTKPAAASSASTSAAGRRTSRGGPKPAASVVDDRHAPARPERADELARVADTVLDLLVDVRQEDDVAARGRERRVVEARPHHLHLRESLAPLLLRERPEHRLLHVGREDAAVGAHRAREADREVARARADIGDRRPGSDAERADHLVGPLPGLAVPSVQEDAVERIEDAPSLDLVHGRGAR
jgi:hypothetical protein